MKKLILFLFLVAQSLAVPLPQDPNDDAEVFSGPINSNAGDNDYDYFGSFVPRVRVFLIPSRPAADDYYYDYPDVQQRPSFDSLFNIVKSFLGARPSSIAPSNKTVSNEKCFLCSVFKDSFDNVQDHINSVRDRENEVDLDGALDDNEVLDVNNSTFTTKVLEDGSVVHINKTTISDVDDDGNSFFFHRAVIHNIGTPDEDSAPADDDEVEYPASVENNEESPTKIEETGVDAGLLDI